MYTLLLLLACADKGSGSPASDDSSPPADSEPSADDSASPGESAPPDSETPPDSEPPDSEGGDSGDPGGDTSPPDPEALWAEIAASVDPSWIEDHILALQSCGTRYTETDGNAQARAYITGQLEDFGLVVEEDAFTFGGRSASNLIARKEGAVDPSVIFIFSAHYDSTSNQPTDDAPGADDNASGVAAVLEAARALSGYETRYSLWFVLTGAEEQGSEGSAYMADWMEAEGLDVRGVMAPDMIGYWPLGDKDALDILGDEESTHLVAQMAEVADALGVANKEWIEHSYCYGDDHTHFQEHSFPAISPMDCVEAHNVPSSGESTPHYHRTSDTLDTLHLPFTTRVAGVLAATFARWGEVEGG